MTHGYWLVYKWQTIITFWASLFFDLHQITLFGDRGKYMHAYNFTKCVIEQLAVEPTSSDWELGLIESPLDWLRVQCSSHYKKIIQYFLEKICNQKHDSRVIVWSLFVTEITLYLLIQAPGFYLYKCDLPPALQKLWPKLLHKCDYYYYYYYCIGDCLQCFCLQCFDAVGWAAERASGL